MSDEETMAEAPQADAAAGLATALIVLTTIMLITAWITTQKVLGDRYNEGIMKKN